MNLELGMALLLLIVWVVLAFVAAIPSGWVHVPLALGCVLAARGIVRGKR
ncbi:MAG: hypothetical protein JSW43_11900 [Gemmatimonadota bacterium]|nr:MAG: hypothetical protein JSW43_11900 [Gemmatimonadota bacterium]